MNTEEFHAATIVEWITDEGKKFLLIFEMVIEKDKKQWMPTETQLKFLAYWATPHFVMPTSVFGQYGITDEEFEFLIEHDISKFEKIVNDNISLYEKHADYGSDFIVKQVAISSIPCKLYDREKHEYED